MKTIDLSRLAPPGTAIKEEIRRLCVGLAGATGCAVLIYGVNYRNAYDLLFDRYGVDRVLRPDAVMPSFDALSWGSLTFFYFVALGSLAAAIFHHFSFYSGGSKSIYLMRRLPQRWELLRRDITLPIAGAAISLLAALLLKLLFMGVYYFVTPEQCLGI